LVWFEEDGFDWGEMNTSKESRTRNERTKILTKKPTPSCTL